MPFRKFKTTRRRYYGSGSGWRRKKTAYGSMPVRSRFRYTRSKKGFIKLLRKLPEIYIRNSAVAGVAQNNDPTTTCVSLGAPIADAVGGTYTIPFSMKFRLDQMINATDITNLADSYRIKKAIVRLTYQSTQSSVNSLSIMPNLQWVQDVDDANVPASINELREKMGVKFKTFGFNKVLQIKVVPALQDTTAGAGGVVANTAPKRRQWLNTTFANVEHFAIKGLLSNVSLPTTAGGLTAFKIDVALAIEAKDFQ